MGLVKCGVAFVLVVAFMASFSVSYTNPFDVIAMNSLYVSMEYPNLIGWIALGGDPCSDGWQGVSCVLSNITSLKLNGLNLGGTLSSDFGLFTSIVEIDISDNHIGGDVPLSLPSTLRNFSLARNQFSGRIPDTLYSLTQLLDLSFHNNLLSGEIPDVFPEMTSLINLDLSGNNLSGQLPPSMGILSSLTTLHLQNNRLTGTLDVLQDLPLEYLNVENNLFSGPIPEKVLGIPNFSLCLFNCRKDGNPFNTSIILSPPPALSPFPGKLPAAEAPWKQANGTYASETPKYEGSKGVFTSNRVIWIVVTGVVVIIILGSCLLISTCYRGRKESIDIERHDVGTYKSRTDEPNSKSSFELSNQEKVTKESIAKLQDQYGLDNRRQEAYPKAQGEQDMDLKRMAAYSKKKMDQGINMTGVVANFMPLPAPPSSVPTDIIMANPIGHASHKKSHSTETLSSCSVRIFTIATLQKYTNSFSEENFVGEGTLGSVYRAELPGGKLLAVKKLSGAASKQQTDEEFLQLVSSISKIQHDNILEFVGYCNEHGQRLLVYKYCENGTLYDALHVDEEIHRKLTWNARIRLALGAARALQYLHEVCQPPIVHCNFKSSNILLDDKLVARVSDCGLSPLKSSGSATEVSGRFLTSHGYGPPELELGSYTCSSDVYSFGVVMLELLTGRKSYDRSLSRGEQYLVRWAIHQLHDIDALSRMVDPSLHGAYPVKSLSRFADIISRCIQGEPEFRPPVSEIVQDLLHML
ncbi:PREDICTED: protein STRUBBELIG-RECEPTOR FAMILY 3-like isoform X3 [Populus euphratica]|uniref:Protein STRUBBELIG-RECEPTOR FAMILY 3-like isoform X3 n=1 Tax=Populus euphratica TaxID=75702 RepID=A0AAJ6UEJ4_POPEU|nr:PREDICTED: protein STRUBBELIG-RECEPTOR FAMILY 3-like isoform X3 [Populus euphratica]